MSKLNRANFIIFDEGFECFDKNNKKNIHKFLLIFSKFENLNPRKIFRHTEFANLLSPRKIYFFHVQSRKTNELIFVETSKNYISDDNYFHK